jgi:hypothetical protein
MPSRGEVKTPELWRRGAALYVPMREPTASEPWASRHAVRFTERKRLQGGVEFRPGLQDRAPIALHRGLDKSELRMPNHPHDGRSSGSNQSVSLGLCTQHAAGLIFQLAYDFAHKLLPRVFSDNPTGLVLPLIVTATDRSKPDGVDLMRALWNES